MGSSNDAVAEGQPGQSAEPEEGSSQRGFFGRILDALSPSDPAEEPSGLRSPAATAISVMHNLRQQRVYDVAMPKAEIVAVPLDITREELVEVFREHGFSRVPVYKDTLDSPQGLVMLKDFALTYGFGKENGAFDLKTLIRPVIYAPPSMPLAVLLQKMQAERVHMALVIDEYGGVDGLVTIEDLLETIVGDIADEHDIDEDTLWVAEKPGTYLVQARIPLEELESVTGLNLRADEDDEDVDTLGGLVFLRVGRVPERGEVVVLESGAEIEVVDADPRRINRLRLRLPGAARGAPAA